MLYMTSLHTLFNGLRACHKAVSHMTGQLVIIDQKCSKSSPFAPENSYFIIEIIYGCGPVARLRQIPHYYFRKNEAHTGIQNSIDRACSICSQDISFPVSERPASKSLLLPQCIAVKYC